MCLLNVGERASSAKIVVVANPAVLSPHIHLS
jgi:hypothetical protein